MHLRKALLQTGDEVQKILKRQIRVQPADNVELRNRFTVTGSRGLERLFEGHGVSAGRIFLAAESAQPASGNADVGRINVAVYVEVRLVAVHALANLVGKPADGQNVASAI